MDQQANEPMQGGQNPQGDQGVGEAPTTPPTTGGQGDVPGSDAPVGGDVPKEDEEGKEGGAF